MFGIPESWAWLLMPVVGSVDIAVGILALLTPRPAVLAYAAAWALLTALLRPLAGESVFEALERAGNYGIPLAFLAAAGVRLWMGWKEWLRPARVLPLTEERLRRVGWALRGTLALLRGSGPERSAGGRVSSRPPARGRSACASSGPLLPGCVPSMMGRTMSPEEGESVRKVWKRPTATGAAEGLATAEPGDRTELGGRKRSPGPSETDPALGAS